jgi:hypothetical protein
VERRQRGGSRAPARASQERGWAHTALAAAPSTAFPANWSQGLGPRASPVWRVLVGEAALCRLLLSCARIERAGLCACCCCCCWRGSGGCWRWRGRPCQGRADAHKHGQLLARLCGGGGAACVV